MWDLLSCTGFAIPCPLKQFLAFCCSLSKATKGKKPAKATKGKKKGKKKRTTNKKESLYQLSDLIKLEFHRTFIDEIDCAQSETNA